MHYGKDTDTESRTRTLAARTLGNIAELKYELDEQDLLIIVGKTVVPGRALTKMDEKIQKSHFNDEG